MMGAFIGCCLVSVAILVAADHIGHCIMRAARSQGDGKE